MQRIDLGRTLGTLANLGVIVGIVFLIAEIQQSNRIATAATEIEIRSLLSGINEALYAVPGVAEFLVKCRQHDATLTPEEEIRLRGLVLRLGNAWQALEVAYVNDVVPSDTFTILEDDIRSFMTAYPATAPIFRSMVETYPGQGSREVFQAIGRVLEDVMPDQHDE